MQRARFPYGAEEAISISQRSHLMGWRWALMASSFFLQSIDSAGSNGFVGRGRLFRLNFRLDGQWERVAGAWCGGAGVHGSAALARRKSEFWTVVVIIRFESSA